MNHLLSNLSTQLTLLLQKIKLLLLDDKRQLDLAIILRCVRLTCIPRTDVGVELFQLGLASGDPVVKYSLTLFA